MASAAARLRWIGERTLRVDGLHGLDALRAAPPPGLVEVVRAYGAAVLHFDAARLHPDAALASVAETLERASRTEEPGGAGGRLVEVPTCYAGACATDLAEVATALGLSTAEVVARHTAPVYTVAFLGFAPGFPYLLGLDPRLQVPRRPSPRVRVPAGSVAIAGLQAGVYPLATPGGWRLLGRTPLPLFDARRRPACLLAPGDRVRFVAAPCPAGAHPEFDAPGAAAPAAAPRSPRESARAGFEVLDPGLLATVQDLGRPGHAADGVPAGGAADALSLVTANRLVGNADGAAAVEWTLKGGGLRAERALVAALAGAPMPVRVERGDGTTLAVRHGAAFALRPGDVVRVGAAPWGARAYLALAGGVDVPEVLGSRSTLLVAGLGGLEGRALRPGDVLPVGPAPASRGDLRALSDAALSELEARLRRPRLRATPGAHASPTFWAAAYRVSARSDRVGVRLQGPVEAPEGGGSLGTEALAPGSVEVPGAGEALLLLPDAPPTGGYAVAAVVARADAPRAGQLRPGEPLGFERVGLSEARSLAQSAAGRFDAQCPPGCPLEKPPVG